MNEPLVSVVMSVFNGAGHLREAIASVLEQTLHDLELVVINDGSTDSSSEILDEYARRDVRMRVYHRHNQGLITSLNFGIQVARAKYIARMDADDICLGDRLSRQCAYMEANQSVAVLGGAVEVIDARGNSLGQLSFPVENHAIDRALMMGQCAFCHPSVLMRAEVIRALGGYRPVALDAEDYDLWLRVSDAHVMANLSVPVLRYRRHSAQVSIRKFKQQALSSIAARSAARSRRRGESDPLDTVREITPAVLQQLGLSETEVNAALIRGYLTCIRSLSDAGESSAAWDTLSELQGSSAWTQADKALAADARLLEALLSWRNGDPWRAATSAAAAISRRPVILGRPLKPALRRLSLLKRSR